MMPRSTIPLTTALFGVLAALLLQACTARGPVGADRPAREVFGAFLAARETARRTTEGFLAGASLNFASPERSMRVVLDFWGNPGGTLRMDMSAGFGTTGAMWRQDDAGLTAYFPLEHAVYVHPDARAAAAALGLGIPLSLRDLATLVSGTYDGLVPTAYESVSVDAQGLYTFMFSGAGPVSSATLDAKGRPMLFAGRLHGAAWELAIGRYDDEAPPPPAPRRLELTMDSGIRAVIRVKRLERKAAPWPATGLGLDVPPGTTVLPALDGDDPQS